MTRKKTSLGQEKDPDAGTDIQIFRSNDLDIRPVPENTLRCSPQHSNILNLEDVMSPNKTWVRSPLIPFSEMDGQELTVERISLSNEVYCRLRMHVELHPRNFNLAAISIPEARPLAMYLEQIDISLLERADDGSFACRIAASPILISRNT